jgi:hypothetical protein
MVGRVISDRAVHAGDPAVEPSALSVGSGKDTVAVGGRAEITGMMPRSGRPLSVLDLPRDAAEHERVNVRRRLVRRTCVTRPMRSVAAAGVVLVVTLSAGSCRRSTRPKPPPTPLSICKARFTGVLDAQANTVQGVTEVGPRPISSPPGHLGGFRGDTAVTLCLVAKSGPFGDDAVAITPDGTTYVVWRQGGSDHLEPPS